MGGLSCQRTVGHSGTVKGLAGTPRDSQGLSGDGRVTVGGLSEDCSTLGDKPYTALCMTTPERFDHSKVS